MLMVEGLIHLMFLMLDVLMLVGALVVSSVGQQEIERNVNLKK